MARLQYQAWSGSVTLLGLVILLAVVTTGAGVYLAATPDSAAQGVGQPSGAIELPATQGRQLVPGLPNPRAGAAPQLSPQEMEAMLRRKLALRDQMAATVDNNPPSPPGLPLVVGPATQLGFATAFPGNPADFVIGRNNLNPQANNPLQGSSLAEPAAANFADAVFAAGNFNHAEFSQDGGITWTDDSPVAPPPAGTDFACCDNDVIIDDAQRVGFHSVAYLNFAMDTAVIRIHVRRNLNGGTDCFYDIGAGPGVNMDYPHLGLTKRFLYLTTNELFSGGQRARVVFQTWRWCLL